MTPQLEASENLGDSTPLAPRRTADDATDIPAELSAAAPTARSARVSAAQAASCRGCAADMGARRGGAAGGASCGPRALRSLDISGAAANTAAVEAVREAVVQGMRRLRELVWPEAVAAAEGSSGPPEAGRAAADAICVLCTTHPELLFVRE